ncbi:MAG: aldo/keto reductase, partial [bacterium]|nr:aldo/keto reductase [bacterium]
MEKREYGNTGEQLSIIGFGGILVSKVDASEASSLVAEAVDHGINYFDVAPTYGNAQQMLGPALAPYRDDVFLACKTTQRTAEGARRELEESLQWMQTDHFDLYQLHAMNTNEDFDTVVGPGGALEVFLEAKAKGQTRYIGISSHSAETALRLIEAVGFDSVLFPISWSTWLGAGFGPQVVAAAEARGMGRLALKGMAYGKLQEGAERKWSKCWYQPIEDPALAALALRFTLSQP